MAIRILLCLVFGFVTSMLSTALVSAQSPVTDALSGSVLPEDINLPPNPLTNWMARHRLRFFGWGDWGYTGSSTEAGLLQVEPRANRFGRSGLGELASRLRVGDPTLPETEVGPLIRHKEVSHCKEELALYFVARG
jgi:hypothetical protein